MDTSPFREGSVLNDNLTNNLLDAIENNLKVKGLPYEWINDLRKSPPRISFLGKTRMGENQALYQPATNPFGLEGDTIYLLEGTNILDLSSSEIATITHELWHAWFDFIPTYPFDDASGFSDAQEEAIGGFIDELADGKNLKDAVSRAITEAEARGGTPQQVIDAILELEKTWRGSFFGSDLTGSNVGAWLILRRLYPEIAQLESLLSETSRQRLRDKEQEKAKIDEEDTKQAQLSTPDKPLSQEEKQANLAPINAFCELDLEKYKQEQKTLLEENWQPPKPPRKGKWLAMLTYRLEKDLSISNITVIESSGYQPLDQSAVDHVNSLQQKIKPFPECYQRDFLDVDHQFKLLFF
ncbi:TonB C-terminal domain-containing protein [Cyanobacterium aponinum UTEX 3222]|uniref:TonB C-terminal domain-containing protein n=1 Tax=Cyanobacterium aponinum TaxID=379064 RepID=UPI002B4BACFD|nr:TonB C-terminal domain-containing protein [Cyanobacterium aponinum]WRL39976.1 TonB C-terminal domain-containing protein [Cyanobacterium aponinum UTEX 3221]WRL42850.1 TonB C-terminal domain-containing protein [Cyanobacterium aponinum UTEX 3222]